ncbi:hypothetical protein ACJX0J_014384, partial [Zea mays]
VTSCKLWHQVGESFKPPKTCTTVSWTFYNFYEKRARLIKRLAKIKEEQGQIDEAVGLMAEEVAIKDLDGADLYKQIMSFKISKESLRIRNITLLNYLRRVVEICRFLVFFNKQNPKNLSFAFLHLIWLFDINYTEKTHSTLRFYMIIDFGVLRENFILHGFF